MTLGKRMTLISSAGFIAVLALLTGVQAANAQNASDDRRWQTLKEGSDRSGLERYLRDFPNGRHRSAVIDRILDIGPVSPAEASARSADETDWKKLGANAGRADLEDYLRRHPQGQHRSTAIDRLMAMGPQVAALAPVKPPATSPARKPRPRTQAPMPPAVTKWQHGQTVRDCSDCPEMVVLHPGTFRLGSPSDEPGRWSDEGPAATVLLRHPVAIGKYEITREQYEDFAQATGRAAGRCLPPSGLVAPGTKLTLTWKEPGFKQTDDNPVVCVNWSDASAYAEWLSSKTGKRYRLPTEAEWEYAARGGTQSARFWLAGYENACSFANVADRAAARVFKDWDAAPCDDGQVFTAKVGSYKANGFGLHDMLGNVWEWVGDCWNDTHQPGNPHEARTTGNCERRVIKGGSWISIERLVRIAARGADKTEARTIGTGFRLVRELER